MSETWAERERRLLEEIARLQFELDEPQQLLDAIRNGRVDAFVINEETGEQVYSLKDLHPPFQLLLEEMGEGAAMLDAERRMTYCNPQLAALAGRPRDEILGIDFHLLLAPDGRESFDRFLETLRHKTERIELALRDGSERIPVNLTGSTISSGRDVVYCIVVADLRELRRREELRAAKEAAEESNRAKDEFLATVSHEVRTPITSILGWIRMMQLDLVDEATRSLALDSMHHSTTSLVKIIDDILDVARLSAGKLSLDLNPIDDLRQAVRAGCEAMRPAAAQKQIDLQDFLPEEPVAVIGDADRLQQVLLNLLSNALKFTPANGKVTVKLEPHGDAAKLSVRDTGQGISAEFLPHVFERFKQADSSTTRANRGLGLGLAIVKQLVEAHRGSVQAFSDGIGRGATFVIALPTAAGRPAGDSSSREARMPSLEGISVLLVEDDAETLRLLCAIVEACGAKATVARSGEEAIAAYLRKRPDVMVSDIVMPDLDGIELLNRVRAISADAPVRAIAVTARSSAQDRSQITAAGFRAYLAKPVEPEVLARLIRDLCQPGESDG